MNYNQATLYAATGKDLIKVPTQVSDWNRGIEYVGIIKFYDNVL